MYYRENSAEPRNCTRNVDQRSMSRLLEEQERSFPKTMESCNIDHNMCTNQDEPIVDNYSDDSVQNEHNPEMDSIRSGESIIKNYIFDNTKYNHNTNKCISFWKAIKESTFIKPCPCEFGIEKKRKVCCVEEKEESEHSFGPNCTWYDVLEKLQKRKLDEVAFAATFQNCKLCNRDEPYAKFKRKMGQNYSDTELQDYEDITCLNCWTSKSIKKPEKETDGSKNRADADMTKIIFMNCCVCEEEKCVCSNEQEDSIVDLVSYQDIANTELPIIPTAMSTESGEGDSLNVNQQTKVPRCPREKESQSLRNFQNVENPSDELKVVYIEEIELEKEVETCECQFSEMSLQRSRTSEKGTAPPLVREDPSLGSSAPVPSKSPADMMHVKFKPGCCYGCGILGCVCSICTPVTPKGTKEPADTESKKTKKSKTDVDHFLDQCEQCGMDCNCWKNKVDHARQYLEDLKQILKENVTYDKACGTSDSEEEIASVGSVQVCIICGHRDCNCQYAHARPSGYFQTIEFGTNLPQTTTFAKLYQEKTKNDESESSGLDKIKKKISDSDVILKKLKMLSLKNRQETPIIKSCKNKLLVTPAQKAKSIIKTNLNLVIKKDFYGVPHVTRYPDKRPILKPKPSEDEESYGSQTEASEITEVIHELQPYWFCTERPKEEEPEITYGKKL